MSTFAENLKRLRKQRKITQTELSKSTGIGRSALSMYETGQREPDFETLEVLADYFNVDMDFLVGRESKKLTLSDEQEVLFMARVKSLPPDRQKLFLKYLEMLEGMDE